ncbi:MULTISPECIES: hypothetical protein [Myxococcus]|uniref:Uncharacterized protein n=1 Tax=Myxococcus llanfairpwllgwyngyllgogerychwyrndrobwllllantysiliogogogochensis TaxID=2590453 RepID=A0A540WRW9_9BACT|nr:MULTISPECIES: hypothetical protein [Myxococcus]NTX04944.1 hypothetical protein [Myxococcus sp. CA040A]NTX37950.1 hypothetical protein [Myxococcus sp. CA033]TQF11765.1 hypothetical protein FJV41_32570 [Myxococcus llanfairpwllgwyngyllgogerychwyrndrobwllllantysiliogogogochensis]
MKKLMGTAIAAATLLVGTQAAATNYTLWIHGRNGGGTQAGNYGDFSYWGPAGTAAGVNKKAVNWNGKERIGGQNARVRDALDCYCTGNNWCYIASHSAGNLQIGYALSLYGGSARSKKNATPNASGVCGNTDGSTQTGWNIKWVNVASGAGGGSELADVGEWAVGEPLVSDLVTTTSRAMYNHNTTRSVWFYMFAGAKGTLYSGILPGQDDEAVSYHSTGGVSGSSGSSQCNPGDWFCGGTLNTGTANTSDGRAKWSFHTVSLRDDGESFNHYANGNWGGIVAKVREDVVKYAY